MTKDAAGTGSRLAWLDVLRGLAALAVVFDHASYYVLHHVRTLVYQWFDPGNYGVFVFFIISGYIVPASLERKGSVRTFWVSRLFRLYPLYLLAVGLAVALYFAHFGSIRGEGSDPETSILSQLLMMSNVLVGNNLPNVVWSLSYEMVFYLLLTALFIARVHKRSSWYALGFAAAAVAIGGLLPQAFFTNNVATPRLIALVADLAVMAGLALAVVLRGTSRLAGAAIAAVVAIALLAFNGGWIWPWEALSILALMFTGTMFYRAEQGQYPWRRAIAIGVAVLGLAIVAGLWHSRAWGMSAHAELLWSRRWVIRVPPGRPDVRGRAGVPPRPLAPGADLARPDQLLPLPAAPAGHRGLPPLHLDPAPPPLRAAGAAGRGPAGHHDRGQLADVPVGRASDAEPRPPGRPLAGQQLRPRPDPGRGARAAAGHGRARSPGHRLARPVPHAGVMALASAAELPSPREPGAPYRVCLVCLGNICRSPMAETVLRAELAAAGLDGAVVVDSAGTGRLARRRRDGSRRPGRAGQPGP